MASPDSDLCLVTGGAGFIGSHTVDALLARGYRVRVLDALHHRIHPRGWPSYLPSEVQRIEGDVSRRADLDRALAGVRYVFHFAAYQGYLLDFSTFIHVNAESTALLYELIVEKHRGVEKVAVASSQAVYGEGKYACPFDGDFFPPPRGEEDLARGEWEPRCPRCNSTAAWQAVDETMVNPHNQYAVSKYAQELVALTLGRRYGIPTVVLRYSIVQGARQSVHNAYSGACPIFCLSLYFDQAPPVYEDGRQVRDFVNIHDVVAANMLVLERPEANGQVVNVGGGGAHSVLEFAETVIRIFDKPIAPAILGSYRSGDTRHIVSDVTKLRRLGWEPRRTPEESVGEYVEWLREQDDLEDVRAYAEQHMRQLGVVRSVAR